MGRWRGRLYATDRARDFDHERDRNVRVRQIYETIDRQKFQWVVVFVAGIGFFLDGYTLFASNIAVPMIAYVYWTNEPSSIRETIINIATLAGTLVGQVTFGILADKYGRKRMYGVELLLVIISTLGVVMSSTGENNSMNIYAWLVFWRTIVGIGVGADYPLSAIITSEFAPNKHRARMMASVFFMQPLGQISGNLVALIVVFATKNSNNPDLIQSVDTMWRWVIGIGVVPGVIAMIFRFVIPETPRFLLDIEDDPVKAEFDTTHLFGDPSNDIELEGGSTDGSVLCSNASQVSQTVFGSITSTAARVQSAEGDWSQGGTVPPTLNSKWTLSRADIYQYFWNEGNWRTLFATAMCWLLLDFGYYGVGLSNPQFLAKTWNNADFHIPPNSPVWKTTDDPNVSIYTMLINTCTEAMVILNIGSFVGGLLMILVAERVNRALLQKYGFLALAAIFIALGVVFITSQQTGPVAITLYVIAQMFFNFGPNATTYMIPGEVFPTRYRASCHGISAGMGKLGSILVQIFSAYYKFGSSSPGAAQTKRYGIILLVFSVAMIAGAAISHFWIPNVQYKDKKNKPLEVLATGRLGPRSHSIARSTSNRNSGL